MEYLNNVLDTREEERKQNTLVKILSLENLVHEGHGACMSVCLRASVLACVTSLYNTGAIRGPAVFICLSYCIVELAMQLSLLTTLYNRITTICSVEELCHYKIIIIHYVSHSRSTDGLILTFIFSFS